METAETEEARQVSGAELLTRVHAVLKKYVAFADEHQPVAVTLWIAATHNVKVWQHATRLAILSPQKRCGKSRLLDLLALLCFSPFLFVNSTTAALYRMVGENLDTTPTVLADEMDAVFGTKTKAEQNEDLRAFFNAGWQRERPVWRCVPPSQTPTKFYTFAMCALAAIRSLPDTITDRAVVIGLQRRGPGEQVAKFRHRHAKKELEPLCAQLTAWLRDTANAETLEAAEPAVPDGIEDRVADAWEPLLAVAELAGGEWVHLAQLACKALADVEDEAADMQLLADIRTVFDETGEAFIKSAALVEQLRALEASPWADKDHELTVRKLARMLKPYGVRPDRDTTGRHRGYARDWFKDAFRRYIRQEPSDRQKEDADQHKQPENGGAADPSGSVGDRQSDDCLTVIDTSRNGENRGETAAHSGAADDLTVPDGLCSGNGVLCARCDRVLTDLEAERRGICTACFLRSKRQEA